MVKINFTKIIRCCRFLILTIAAACCWGTGAVGAQSVGNVNIVFVLDISYSMNETDKNNFARDLPELFANLNFNARTKAGIVAYNDTAEIIFPLTEMNSENAKANLAKNLASIKYTGRTDTGLGLQKGWEILLPKAAETQSLIVLITDGEVDVNPSGRRRAEDSLNDIAAVAAAAQSQQIPVYTIALGNHFDQTLLKDIAQKTRAAFHVVEQPQDIPEVIGGIFNTFPQTTFYPAASVAADGKMQAVNIKLPDSSAAQTNIFLTSSSVLREIQIPPLAKDAELYQNRYYAAVKIQSRGQKELNVTFQGEPESIVTINLVSHYDLKGYLDFDVQPEINRPLQLRFYFQDNLDETVINDKDFYASLNAKAFLKNRATGEEIALAPQAREDGILINHIFRQQGEYLFRLEAADKNFTAFTQVIQAQDVPPDYWSLFFKISLFLLLPIIGFMIYYREKQIRREV